MKSVPTKGKKATPKKHTGSRKDGLSEGQVNAAVALLPRHRHAVVVASFSAPMLSEDMRPDLRDVVVALKGEEQKTASGDMKIASDLLTTQALSLDSMFTDLARRALLNMGQYPDAADRYMRLALKAQSNCRTTIEALAKLHQPREQTVRHVHVNQGGQAVIADQFHHHTGGKENGQSADQPHEQRACSTALLSQDASGNGVPMSCDAGQEALLPARRQITGRP